MRWFSLTLLLAAAFSALLAQQPATLPSAPTDPRMSWEFDSGG
jgi:hypothetical protein